MRPTKRIEHQHSVSPGAYICHQDSHDKRFHAGCTERACHEITPRPSAAFAPKSQKQIEIPDLLPWLSRPVCAQAFVKRDRSTCESVYGECTVNIATKTARPMTCSRKRRNATPTIVRMPSSVRRTESGRPRVSIPQIQLQ